MVQLQLNQLLLKTPVELEIIDGKIKSFKSKDQIIKKNIEEIFSNIKNQGILSS